MSAVNYNNNQDFVFTTEGGVLSKILFSSNFYDTNSEQYKVILQEKLNGSYTVQGNLRFPLRPPPLAKLH